MTVLYDISQTVTATTPTWPGDTVVTADRTWQIDAECPVNVARVTMSTHTGTHADAPLHYDARGHAIDAVSLAPYLGRARVVDLRGRGPLATAAMIAPALAPGVERVLLRTYDRFPADRWDEAFMAIDADAVRTMAAHGVILIGTDAPSIDPQHSKTLDAHHAVRAADMRILEGLVLDGVSPGDYELIALPLKLGGLDAAPVRAVLRTIP